MIPKNWLASEVTRVPKLPLGAELVTEWWLDRCVRHKVLLEPAEDVMSRGFVHLSPTCMHSQTARRKTHVTNVEQALLD